MSRSSPRPRDSKRQHETTVSPATVRRRAHDGHGPCKVSTVAVLGDEAGDGARRRGSTHAMPTSREPLALRRQITTCHNLMVPAKQLDCKGDDHDGTTLKPRRGALIPRGDVGTTPLTSEVFFLHITGCEQPVLLLARGFCYGEKGGHVAVEGGGHDIKTRRTDGPEHHPAMQNSMRTRGGARCGTWEKCRQ